MAAGLEAALAKGGVDVDQEDQDGGKLLHVAAANGALEACKVQCGITRQSARPVSVQLFV